MNINPAAVNAISIAKDIGLVGVPINLPVATRPDTILDTTSSLIAMSMHGYNTKGIADVEPHGMHHAVVFYNKLIPLFPKASASFHLIEKSKYSTILTALKCIYQGETLSSLQSVYPNIHYWNKAYAVDDGDTANALVAHPKHPSVEGMENVELHKMKRVTYVEKVFADLLIAHGPDHNKGRTLYSCLAEMEWDGDNGIGNMVTSSMQTKHSVTILKQ